MLRTFWEEFGCLWFLDYRGRMLYSINRKGACPARVAALWLHHFSTLCSRFLVELPTIFLCRGYRVHCAVWTADLGYDG